ncbi:ABC transporter ATP-binding protein [Microbulbifer marinus]|uniref:Lipopolysaccharide transport system ATP-binding protein n=1 Tax=Microbulbifer marinus TaxID=658218 RepID=A0A1H3VVK4_9GAMM|nr:ATP-binding cassette domain-containing protein [Microbulbifer marinus]SDZ78826.1 lipopolysaccharide transport system ATP-binding protein [Microbulbifer marinus]
MNREIMSFDNVGLAYRRSLNPFSQKNWVLKEINFQLFRGEVLGVIGHNGAGKSTLLRLLAGIIAPNQGKIFKEKGVRSQLLTLNLGFIHKLSGFDNAIMSLVTQGKTIKEANQLLDGVIEFSGIGHLMDHSVSTYSAGERARLGFAIAMQATPDILLLDEMLGVGDKEFKRKSGKALQERVQSDQTAVLVSHSAGTIRKFCERALWIEDGLVKALGPTDEVLDRYEQSAPDRDKDHSKKAAVKAA